MCVDFVDQETSQGGTAGSKGSDRRARSLRPIQGCHCWPYGGAAFTTWISEEARTACRLQSGSNKRGVIYIAHRPFVSCILSHDFVRVISTTVSMVILQG